MINNIFKIFISALLVSLTMTGCAQSSSDQKNTSGSIILESVEITLANGEKSAEVPVKVKGRLVATANYSDGSQKDITLDKEIKYSSSDDTVVSIENTNELLAVKKGDTEITAIYADVQSNVIPVKVTDAVLERIVIKPSNLELPINLDHQYSATGFYDNNDSEDITNIVGWKSSDETIASFGVNGMLTTIKAGDSNITASLDSISHTTAVYVINPTLVKWYIEGATSVTKGLTTHLVAKGDYDNNKTYDVSAFVTWSSDKTENVSVDNDGMVTGVNTGAAQITATRKDYTPVETKTHNMTVVNETFEYIQIELDYSDTTPNPVKNVDVALGGSEYLTAWGYRTNGDRVYVGADVLWLSADKSIAEINGRESSRVYGISVGDTIVTATLRGISTTVDIKVAAGNIFIDNIRWESEATVTKHQATGQTGKEHGGIENRKSTAVWYYLQKGQGYIKGQTVGETNFSFDATLNGSTTDVYTNVYLYDKENDSNEKVIIHNDAEWETLKQDSDKKLWIIRTNYSEKSEGTITQSNFILRLGSSTYENDDPFKIGKFIVTLKK